MEKASRALRRSGVKILSMGGANSDLSVTLSEVKNMRTSAKAFMTAQNLASRDMLRWASHEDNRAIQDIINQMSELNLLWTDVQTEFVDRLKEYKHMFEMVLAGEKQVYLAKQNYTVSDQKEMKYRKELSRAVKKGALESEIRMLRTRVTQAERAKDIAYIDFRDKMKENECIKLIRLKAGLVKTSEAYIEMSTKCSLLFSAQRDVVLQLPDVHGRDLDEIKYTGRPTTLYVVEQARNQIKKYRRNSQSDTSMSDPPPPYTPPDTSSDMTIPTSEVILPVRNTPPPPRSSDTSTPPPYQQADISPGPVSNRRRSEPHSLPVTTYMHNTINQYGSLPTQSSVQAVQPTQECSRRRSETIPRTGSRGRIIPRNPAPPVPQQRTSISSSDSSIGTSSEGREAADAKPIEEVGQKLSDNVFKFDSRDVATQSQNATFQSSSLYSSVGSAGQVHVCPSGLPSPSVEEYIESSPRLITENSPPVQIQSQNKENTGLLGSNTSSVSNSVTDDKNRNTSQTTESGMVAQCGIKSETGGSAVGIGTDSGVPESSLGLQTFRCVQEISANPIQETNTSHCKDEFENIPFIDSMQTDLSPTLLLGDFVRDGSVCDDQGTEKVKGTSVYNKGSEQGRDIVAIETGGSGDLVDAEEKYDTAEEEELFGAVGGGLNP